MTDSVPLPADPATDLRQTWADRFQRFTLAELSVAQFCRDEGVSVQAFYYWRRKLLAPTQQTQQAEAAAQLIPIHVLHAPLYILLPGGARLPLTQGCDLALVRDLLLALEALSC